MRTLLIDNYDSYTFNLYQLISEVSGAEPIVVRNDHSSWDELDRLRFDSVIISPGPGTPLNARDFGICASAVRRSDAPLLGVCLGHQGLGALYGGRVEPAPAPMHGRISPIHHTGTGLFDALPQGFDAVRYHSLVLASPLPRSLERIAWTEEGTVMAIRHRERPQWGVQFHPESICTEHGRRLLENFLALARRHRSPSPRLGRERSVSVVPTRPARNGRPPRRLRAEVLPIDAAVDSERVFEELFADAPHAFWLDSSRAAGGSGRFSFMGAIGGGLGRLVRYTVGKGVEVVGSRDPGPPRDRSLFDYLHDELARYECPAPQAPFDFAGGFVGYLGYELKAECGSSPAHASALPDAQLLFVDRFVAIDHEQGNAFLVELTPDTGSRREPSRWLAQTERAIGQLAAAGGARRRAPKGPLVDPGFVLHRPRHRYLADIERCQDWLLAGDAYEICLTNQLEAGPCGAPLELYKRLRAINPAPYAAYLRFGDLAILSSSPERFLRLGADRRVDAKPIKGTAGRGRTAGEDAAAATRLRESAKERAENLMIVDLLRNDLGTVCEVGSVHVPKMMEVESYETVHQLVSTVRGRLRSDLGPADCVRAAFPGGSMTGAPKRRVMEIIDELEGRARGVYSGAIGYLSVSGTADLSIAIRTLVSTPERTTIGAGGAIVVGADPEREFEEMMLKARAPIEAALGRPSPAAKTVSRRL